MIRCCCALRRNRLPLRALLALAISVLAIRAARAESLARETSKPQRIRVSEPSEESRIDLPIPDPQLPLTITADAATHWMQGAFDVWVLHGQCRVEQGQSLAQGRDAVLWVLKESSGDSTRARVIAYLEGNVTARLIEDGRSAQLKANTWLAEFETTSSYRIKVPETKENPSSRPEIYKRALARRDPHQPGIVETQRWSRPGNSPLPTMPSLAPPPQVIGPAPVLPQAPPGTRRLLASPRSSVPPQVKWFSNPAQTEWIATIDSGINLVVEGVGNLGVIDVSSDRAVLWMGTTEQPNLTGGARQLGDQPLEIYLEGNVVFREGDRRIYADRLYYNVKNENGMVLGAEVKTPAPKINGLLRLKAELVQITGRDTFVMRNSYVTSSNLGTPAYRMQSSTINVTDNLSPAIDPATGTALVDADGEPVVDHRQLVTSRNNVVFLGPVPVFYWPVFSADVTDASFVLRTIQVRNDRVFGTSILTTLNAFELFGIRNKPAGTDWTLHTDYLSKRGPAAGTTLFYNTPRFFGMDSPASGLFDAWGILDHGADNLGLDRRVITPPSEDRYRILGRHRQLLPNNFMLSAEIGVVSDRNFLESYFEREWDEFKDQSTDIDLRRLTDNNDWYVRGQARPNQWFTDTQWLPRADHYWLGQSLLNDRLTWYEHSSAGYANYQIAAFPNNSIDAQKFVWFPWEQNAKGERLLTRQELDLPLDLGPIRIVPFGLGELGHWGQGLSGQPVNRAYGQAGFRGSLPFWSANPNVESSLFNVHGLAHKGTLEADFQVSGTNQNYTTLPLYDPINDNNIEQFERRYVFNTFGGPTLPNILPTQFDPRFYALRAGIQDWVASPTPEIVNNFMALRLGTLQRLQTKRGLPGQRRIIDWMTFEAGITYFPVQNRDNFGVPFGLANYNYMWHIGDRFSILSNGMFDFFSMGQRIWNVGGFLTRPPRGSLYVGFRWLDGPVLANVLTPFRSRILTASYTYQLSPKWLSTVGTSLDLAGRNIGQNISITRIGESFLTSAGFNVDASKGNVGMTLLVEPRFMAKGQLRGYIPPPDTVGLQ